ncbi:MAG: MarR family transcriptional regulator [Eubacteriales bacterium]|nr:MarR family transcriptional regulator [Eubacteriales bacterium]
MDFTKSGILNELLVSAYNGVNKVEDQALKKTGANLSITEFHILESINKNGEEGRTIGDIAQDLSVTMPTVTVAVSKLEKKGYVLKSRGKKDGRHVYITLTKQGNRMNMAHRYFHKLMIRELFMILTDEEVDILIRTLEKLNRFFENNYNKSES